MGSEEDTHTASPRFLGSASEDNAATNTHKPALRLGGHARLASFAVAWPKQQHRANLSSSCWVNFHDSHPSVVEDSSHQLGNRSTLSSSHGSRHAFVSAWLPRTRSVSWCLHYWRQSTEIERPIDKPHCELFQARCCAAAPLSKDHVEHARTIWRQTAGSEIRIIAIHVPCLPTHTHLHSQNAIVASGHEVYVGQTSEVVHGTDMTCASKGINS